MSETLQQYTCPRCGEIGAHGKDSKAPSCHKCRELGHVITMSKSHNGIIIEYISDEVVKQMEVRIED